MSQLARFETAYAAVDTRCANQLSGLSLEAAYAAGSHEDEGNCGDNQLETAYAADNHSSISPQRTVYFKTSYSDAI